MLLLGQPFINVNTKVTAKFNTATTSFPLLKLADFCRTDVSCALDVLEKAILLILLHADITCVDERGNNVLHCVLQASFSRDCLTDKEMQAEAWMVAACDCDRCNALFRQPRQLLKAAIAAGANIYAINGNGNTPTMAAEANDRDEEWIKALEECGIDAEEVLLHTTAWKNVLGELEDEYSGCSCEVKAKFVDFDSSFWDSGNRQKSSLSFEEFCERRDTRRKLQVDCDYKVAEDNHSKMLYHFLYVEEDVSERIEENTEKSTETLENVVEGAQLHVEDELKVLQSIQPFGPTELYNEDMESDDHDGVIDIFDDLAKPVGNDDVVDTGNVYGNNRDPDMVDAPWDDYFDFEAACIGTP
jgi:hypothetical protein